MFIYLLVHRLRKWMPGSAILTTYDIKGQNERVISSPITQAASQFDRPESQSILRGLPSPVA